ncbi:hypothetical protein J2I47_12285 [Fibrella sp. HMF5335]|uniref:Uncharacterized protein n=1 Tax=Fibrella rubiginis TaxID=2817060 RepID=A0A939GIE4_9BACT|nr:hypothetical protein [Fibrella rubiginis]MBO0937326.1 hypothetical protein [Fibrella rubiginis]
MSNKFNSNALNEYSKSYARRVAADFYHAHPTISGKQILNLTPIQQVNLFVVSSLFDKWKGEVERFRSPYFDFSNPEVEEGLRAFMNVVSQHIAVRREHLEPLLADASRRTLVALFDPRYYYDDLLRNQPDFTLTADSLKHITRYTQVNKFVPLALEQKMNGRPFVYVNQALGYLDEILSGRAQELERPDKYVAMFSEKVAMDLASLLRGQSMENYQSTTAKSFFDLDEDQPKPPLVAPATRPVADAAPAAPTPPPTPALPTPVPQHIDDEQPSGISFADADPESSSSAVAGPNNAPNIVSAESSEPSLSVSAGSSSPQPDHDSVATLGDTLQKVSTGSLSRTISLNQKFRFINQLFNGNVDAYNEALAELDQMTNYGQALDLISYRYANQFMWNMDSDEVSELVEILKRRF